MKLDIFGQSGFDVLVESMVTGDSSRAIENQEKQGQGNFVNSEFLPKECNFCDWSQLEQMGIIMTEEGDDLFVKVELPEGWKKVPTSHSMWSELLDDKGRVRANIFYKAAFYDRDAHISIVSRFRYAIVPTDGWENSKTSEWECVVEDAGKVIWKSENKVYAEPEDRDSWRTWYDAKQSLAEYGKQWLEENYPDYTNPLAYWND